MAAFVVKFSSQNEDSTKKNSLFVEYCGVSYARSMASSSSGIFAAEDFANHSQIFPLASLHRDCEGQCEPQKFLVFLHAGPNILWFLDEWKV